MSESKPCQFCGGFPCSDPDDTGHCFKEQPAQSDFPTGAIENGRAFIDRLETHYSFECEAGPLKNCTDWYELIRCFNPLEKGE